MAIDLNRLEIERIDNLVRNFGWLKIKEEISGTKIILTFEKPRIVSGIAGSEGAD